MTIALLCAAAFAAGLTDSVVGGGGLIQLPILLMLLPGAGLAAVLGTNKLSSIFGTGAAAVAYSRKVKIEIALTAIAASIAFAFSMLGARVVTELNPHGFKPAILAILIAMAAFTFANKEFGVTGKPAAATRGRLVRGALIGTALGFYDGFIGPGTGSILIFLFVGAVGMDFLGASATAKIVNFATNLSAILFFAATGHIIYRYALPMAACNIGGGILGANLAIQRGNRFVRAFFIVVVVAVIVRYAFAG
jgi:hypothetical protein